MTSSIPPRFVIPAAAIGLAWNLFGATRFVATELATEAALVAGGMTPAQAALYAGLPGWMALAFALGVFGGVAGCVLMLLRRRAAVPVLAASLAGYLVLFAGDVTQGVFAAFGLGQVAILLLVLAVAAGLLALAWRGLGMPGKAVLSARLSAAPARS
ncbi:hypothetical protein [Falsiroseomonas sp. HW251]|uniref:hypothetical protein n=1 Tax=Falsiroseomonas sp. HW251 TaxID=3390998 RepID=UPI003D310BEF